GLADQGGVEPGGGGDGPDLAVGALPDHPGPDLVAGPMGPAAPGRAVGGGVRADRGGGLPAVLLQRAADHSGGRGPAARIPRLGAGGGLGVAAARGTAALAD